MNSRPKAMILWLAVLSTVTGSCVEPVEFETGHEAPLVVHCILTESDVQELDIRLATTYGKNGGTLPELISAELQNSHGERICSFVRKNGTQWSAEMTPSYGEVYRLSVRVDNKEIIHAMTRFPHEVYVKQFMKRRDGLLLRYLYLSCELRVPFTDSEGYKIKAGAAYDGSANLWVFPTAGTMIGTTHPYADDFNLETEVVGDLPCFSRDSMKLWSMDLNEEKRWIKETYSDVRLHEGFVRIPSPAMFDNGEDPATISDKPLYTTRSFIFFADYPRDYYPYYGGLFDIRIVSDELDRYLKDVYQKDMNMGRDMRLIYDHENSYSNISGGLGIFGAMLCRTEERAIRGYNDDF